ncbi:MAG: hybrid sensor histidine kinase/response regulator [Chloroflexi bacterium]|nr:hybrid sensor histidine kinase/response regulator [Chloroflexota bacterium]
MQNGTKASILLVDDDPAILDGVADLLRLKGYHVVTAPNGKQALDRMEESVPDIIVSDIMMPDMDGYAFFNAVRTRSDWTTIPFIFLTARGQKKDVRRGNEVGVDAYLTKPFEPEDLIVLINSRLKRIGAIQEAAKADIDKVKNQLITIFSHELRTPLTYIYGYVNLLHDQHTDMQPDEVNNMIDGMQRGAERLVHLVEDLMMMVRLDSGIIEMEVKLRQEPIDLTAVIQSALYPVQSLAAAHEVTLNTHIKPGIHINCVPAYLSEALTRLVDNAVKFCNPMNGIVDLRADVEDDQVRISVTDNGSGLTEEQLKLAFEPLMQINRQSLEQQGLGLGLSITRSIVEVHGGHVEAESEPGRGSTFTVVLPTAIKPEERSERFG